MVKVLKEIFNTPEGWAVALGLVWASVAQFVPPVKEIRIEGFGSITPAMLLLYGVPFVLAKVRRDGSTPFQPIVTGSGAKTLAVAAVVGALLLAGPAAAQEVTPPLSSKRIGMSVGAGLTSYDSGDAPWGKASGALHGALAYSTGKQLSVGASGRWDWEPDTWTWELGPRVLLVGDGSGERAQLAVGANLVWYDTEDVLGLEDGSSWNAGAYASYLLGKSANLRWYVTGDVTHDPGNQFTTFHLLGRVSGLMSDWF